jgi:hypothetical protein
VFYLHTIDQVDQTDIGCFDLVLEDIGSGSCPEMMFLGGFQSEAIEFFQLSVLFLLLCGLPFFFVEFVGQANCQFHCQNYCQIGGCGENFLGLLRFERLFQGMCRYRYMCREQIHAQNHLLTFCKKLARPK